ncbi:HEAT repeat domain-containing protein [Peptococcaceae bacterium 1198_IL3148]
MQANAQKYSKEIKTQLFQGLECLFLDEWGGPRSELAINYLRQNVIPQLINCLLINHRYLENNTFIDILTNKLNTEFAYPLTFAEGLAPDVTKVAIKILGQHQDRQSHPWKPWEDVLRMITVGHTIKDIADKTAFSESYIESFRKRYVNFANLAEGLNADFDYYAKLPQLKSYGNQLLRFMVDFNSRFKVFKNYYARLQAEQVIFDFELPLNVDELLQFLEGMYYNDKQFNREKLINQLAASKEMGTGLSGLFSNRQHWQIKNIIDELIENHLLVQINNGDGKLSLSSKAAMLIVPIISPRLAQEILDLLNSRDSDRISRSIALVIGKNSSVAVHVIKQLTASKDPVVILFFKALHRRVSKPVLLEIISACAEFGGNDVVGLITKALQHRDSIVRVKACQAIEKLADKAYYFYLIAALHDDVPIVREHVVKALAALNMPSAIRHLEEMLIAEENITVRRLIKETIAKFK